MIHFDSVTRIVVTFSAFTSIIDFFKMLKNPVSETFSLHKWNFFSLALAKVSSCFFPYIYAMHNPGQNMMSDLSIPPSSHPK